MQLNETIARQIVSRAMKIIPHSVNVMNEEGRIIGSGDPSRILQKHEGAVLAIADKRIVEIDHATAGNLKGVKPGVNLPILYLDKVIGVIGISGQPESVRPYGELVKMTAEMIVEHAALMSQVEWNKRHREELVLQLIQGANLNETQLQSIAERLDLDLSIPRVAAIVKVFPDNDTPLSLEHLQQLVHLLEYPERDNLVGILSVSNNEVVVLKPVSLHQGQWSTAAEMKRVTRLMKRIKREAKFTIKLAIGDYFTGVEGLAHSFETAKLTMKMCQAQESEVLFFQDRQLPILLSSVVEESWKAQKLRTPYQKLRRSDNKGTLMRTLKAFFAQNCDLHQTAQSLHIHRNTLRYRLDKINQETSLNINNIDDLFHLYLAMQLFDDEN
ncbi:sugar diacid recognition domain-containing protein [Vibrio sp. CAU 1672]|uniref:sugar diacid recognition domain-containing protein n=1 Tax=Vibrio sp. CAU 1672 TaxID=3032594 RepID=UPI0023DBCCEA|nr:sugar diacid recognition domain-containing protein [Vibrio sp. CAU 1672]MDF2152918.1 sugar diacid recognition domain-containing protein [Vibrio sp. CAU 1672]